MRQPSKGIVRLNAGSLVGEVRMLVPGSAGKCSNCGATLRSALDQALHFCHVIVTARRSKITIDEDPMDNPRRSK
jgi:hypothetical protein